MEDVPAKLSHNHNSADFRTVGAPKYLSAVGLGTFCPPASRTRRLPNSASTSPTVND